jgi:hypothetical protein
MSLLPILPEWKVNPSTEIVLVSLSKGRSRFSSLPIATSIAIVIVLSFSE